jgi:hypothetical protein
MFVHPSQGEILVNLDTDHGQLSELKEDNQEHTQARI